MTEKEGRKREKKRKEKEKGVLRLNRSVLDLEILISGTFTLRIGTRF